MIEIKNNDKIKVSFTNRFGTRDIYAHIGTLRASYSEDIIKAEKYGWKLQHKSFEDAATHEKSIGGKNFWSCQRSCCLCSDPGHYDREREEWKDSIRLENGEKVVIEGEVVTVKVLGDFSDPVHFIRGV